MKIWYFIHKWTSVICAIFVLLLCLTGLPLIFKAEIAALTTDRQSPAILPADTPLASLDQLTSISQTLYPGENIRYISLATNEPVIYIGMTLLATKQNDWLKFDAHTAQLLERFNQSAEQDLKFLSVMNGLHRNLLAGRQATGCLG